MHDQVPSVRKWITKVEYGLAIKGLILHEFEIKERNSDNNDKDHYYEPGKQYYVWITQGDSRVRPEHRARHGKIYDMDERPLPGEAYNCRCVAQELHNRPFPKELESFIDRKDISTWPRPHVSGKLREGLPSRARPIRKGERSLYDKYGGEWRPGVIDKYHNLHWDYKPPGKQSEWGNISINNMPTRKKN